jgi:hypothetical protein
MVELDRNSGAGPGMKKDVAAKVMMINWGFAMVVQRYSSGPEVSLAAHI